MNVVFVTTEMAPLLPGGAGTVVAELARRLQAEGNDVKVVLVTPEVPTGEVPDWVHVVAPGPVDAAAPTRFLAASRAAAEAVADVVASGGVDLVEFQDFDALGFWALAHRAAFRLGSTRIAVRFHGPVDLMFEAVGHMPPELEPVAAMEADVYRMADVVLVPSATIGGIVTERYGVEPERVVVAQPPVPDVPTVPYVRSETPELVCYGRLGEVKGSHDLLEAVLPLVEEESALHVRFVGADGWSVAAGTFMSDWLKGRIPARVRHRFSFEPPIDRAEMPEAFAGTWAVVMPSRFESFSLAAHEVRNAGLPIVLPDLPGFQGFFTETTGAVIYDGTVSGLTDVLGRLLADPDRLDRLAAAPPPLCADPLDPYRRPLPPPRHPRSQAGRATAAVQRLDSRLRRSRRESLPAKAAKSVLRLLPEPVAAVAVRLLPRSIKDRFRKLASWPAEAARRHAEARRAELRRRIEAGEFAEEEQPDVTVVVPCFNQGAFVEDAVVSVFQQTYASWEVVVVDDGSTDPDTQAVLAGLDYPRVRLIRQENQGLSGARNIGIGEARGRYVVPLDADDELAPAFLETLVAALETNPEAGYAHCYAELFGDVEAIWMPRPFNPYQELLSNSVVGCVVLRRDAWEQVGGYDETLLEGNEDWDLWLRLLEHGWGQVMVPEALFRYRKHGVSMSVETEAGYETARMAVARRHRTLYTPETIRRTKQMWYPLVTVLVAEADALPSLAGQTCGDLEVITVGDPPPDLVRICDQRGWPLRRVDDLDGAVRSARGKYLAEWGRIRVAAPEFLLDTAKRLEADTDAAYVTLSGGVPAVWRRWCLLDPNSGHAGALTSSLAEPSDGESCLVRGGYPTTGWYVDPALTSRGLPIHRQPPEEDGFIPDWVWEVAT